MTTRIPWALCAAAFALSGASLGCSHISSCNRPQDEIEVHDGYVNADGTWYSSVDPAKLETADGGKPDAADLPSFTYFPANRSIKFYLGLVDTPTDVNPFLSFSPDGDATVAPCAGNQCLIRTRNKNYVVIHNDTCSEFWVWLTASTSGTPFHQVTDAGAEGGASSIDPTDTAGAAGAQ